MNMDDFELEKLRNEIQQEKQMKEMLEQSAAELRATVEELEKRYDTIDNEGNEWKTRFETQQEMNEQLERQILMLQNKVQEAKTNLKDAGKTPRDLKNFDDLSDANAHMVQMLEREKHILQGQLRDLEWRLDQESKAYHKANDERKSYALEINTTKGVISELVTKQKMSSSREHLETIPGSRTPRAMGSRISLNDGDTPSPVDSPRRSKIKVRHTNYRSIRQLENEIRNIPEDRRILDPKRGPIQKTAAVKNLPSLEST